MLTHDIDYPDLGPDHFTRLGDPDRRAQRLIEQLTHLGYTVQLTPAA